MANKVTTYEQLTQVMNALANKIKEKDYEQKANLKALAYKDSIEKTDLSSTLQDEISNMANANDVVQQINTQIASVYKPGGSKVAADLANAPVKAQLGYVYNITEDFTTNANFTEGAGKAYTAGQDVAVVVGGSTYTAVTPEGTENPKESGWFVEDTVNAGEYIAATDETVVSGTTYYSKADTYQWNVLAGFIDQASFVSTTEFEPIKDKVDELTFAENSEIQAIIDGIDLENGTTVPAQNGDSMSY